METIHLKTVDPISQEILLAAARREIPLLWERFEKMQPQDGFLRLGLSCPYGCLQGPCRIDPFGRGADRGICGLDRDGMAAALFLRLVLCGCLESGNPFGISGKPAPAQSPVWEKLISRAVKNFGGGNLSPAEPGECAQLLSRPMADPEELIRRALRMGLLALTFAEKNVKEDGGPRTSSISAGYGLLSEKKWNIAIGGQPEDRHLKALAKLAGQEEAQILSLGAWIPLDGSYLPIVCSSGEGELALASGRIHLLIAGPGTDPALIELCRSLGISCLFPADGKEQKKALQRLRREGERLGSGSFTPDSALIEKAQVIKDAGDLAQAIRKKSPKHLCFLGGADTPQQSLGWIPGEAAASLIGKDCLVGAWGDAALWILKKKLCSTAYESSVKILNPEKGPILALQACAATNRIKDLKICYTGLKTCKDLAFALGAAALGAQVCAAVPLPLWGSEKDRKLLMEGLATQGAEFQHFDHPPGAQEILDWFSRNGK